MTVKELIEKLKKYPEDTQVFTEYRDDNFWIIYIDEPWLDFKEEIKYDVEEDWRKSYASYLRHDWIMNNVLVID